MTTKHEWRRDDIQRPIDRIDRRLLIGMATVVLLLTGACDGGEDAPTTDQPPVATGPSEEPADAAADEAATSFLEAYGAFDVDQAITYLADDALISELAAALGAGGEGTPEEFRLLVSWLEAAGYEQTLNSCEEQGSSSSGTRVRCTFDFHLFRSEEIGLGPFSGSSFDLIVRDGEVVRASKHFEVEEFSPQVWEPFAEWVSTTYPEDAAVMYADESLSGVRLTEESIRLWERRTREYVEEAGAGT